MECKIIIEDTNKMMDSKMNICIQGLKKFEEIKIVLETNCFYNINAPYELVREYILAIGSYFS